MSMFSRINHRITNIARLANSYASINLLQKKFDGDKLEIGSGPVKRPQWVTLDMCKGADIFWDLRLPLPFSDDRFSFIYSSHVIEHFQYRQLDRLLREMHRILRPGGIMSICVPDARIYIDLYNTKADPQVFLEYKPAVISKHSMDVLNYMFYMDGQHKMMFDPENLIYHLGMRGFVDCVERNFDGALDMVERRPTSFYVECRKSA